MKWSNVAWTVVLVMLVAGVVLGVSVNSDVVPIDTHGNVIPGAFLHTGGDSVLFVYSTAGTGTVVIPDSVDFNVSLGGYVGKVWVEFPDEDNAVTAWFRFKERNEGLIDTVTYSWGDWQPVLIGGEPADAVFEVALAESMQMVVVGSGFGKMSAYYRYAAYRD